MVRRQPQTAFSRGHQGHDVVAACVRKQQLPSESEASATLPLVRETSSVARRLRSRRRSLVGGSSSAGSRALTIASRTVPAELCVRGRLLTARQHERKQAPRCVLAHYCCFPDG